MVISLGVDLTDHENRKSRSGRRGNLKYRASQVVNQRNPCSTKRRTTSNDGLKTTNTRLRICTWNVRSLYQAGKLDNLLQEMNRLAIDILGISELRWKGSGMCQKEDCTLYYSCNDDPNHPNGVGIMVSKRYSKYVSNFTPITDRLILLQLRGHPFNVNILQIYAPTTDKKYDDEVETLYNNINNVLKSLKNDQITIILGDFNAKIGKGRRSDLVGDYGLGESNQRGDRLYEFCQNNDMIVTNTWFKLPKRRLYTWTAPHNEESNTGQIRNQIDYILINKRFRNAVKSVKTYPGADVGSDHNPLIGNIELKLKIVRKSCRKRPIDVMKLQDGCKRSVVAENINENLAQISQQEIESIESLWDKIKKNIIEPCTKHLGPDSVTKKKKWMTNNILNLMEQRRLLKYDQTKYKELQKVIRKEIKSAKEIWMKENCEEIDKLSRTHDDFNMHRKIKEITGIYRKHIPTTITNPRNELILSEQDIKETWKSYITDVFTSNREEVNLCIENREGPTILKSEVLHAISIAKNRKASGPDELPIEAIKLIDEDNINLIVKLFNMIYETGNIPHDWLRSTFITIPKKLHPRQCSDYRLISLMSHMLKTFLRIIHARIRKKCEEDLDYSQFGFRNAFGTREALFGINVMLQKCRDQRKDVFICFLDYEKAFDRIHHDKLLAMLEEIGLDRQDIQLIKNLYWGQTANIRIGNITTDDINIQKGVRQGCILSPLLFNLYSDRIFKEALEELGNCGIKVNGIPITTIRYADDTVILSDSIENLQTLFNKINVVGVKYGLNINSSKTKFMIVSRTEHNNLKLEHNGIPLERVSKFKYLGSFITEALDPDIEIKQRIEVARTAFNKMRSLLCDDNLSLKLRQHMTECYVWSILLYGAEAWTLKINTMNRLEAFEMWLHRRMLRIPWVDHVTNTEVLRRANSDRQLITAIKCRKIAYLGHVLRGEKYHLLQTIMKGKIEGRRGPGRRQHSWLRNIRDWTGIRSVSELIRVAEDRDALAIVIANVRETGHGI